MFKTSKLFDTMMIILFLSFIGLVSYLAIEMKQAEKANNSQSKEFVTFEYEVSWIDSEGLYAKSSSDNTGIYITMDKLQPDQEVKEGDTIKVSFDAIDLVEGIEHIEVVANGQ